MIAATTDRASIERFLSGLPNDIAERAAASFHLAKYVTSGPESKGKERLLRMEEATRDVIRYTPLSTRSTRASQPLNSVKMKDLVENVEGNTCMNESPFKTPAATPSSRASRTKKNNDKSK